MPLQRVRQGAGYALLKSESGLFFNECCCDLSSCSGCCCDARVPLWFQPPVTVDIRSIRVSSDLPSDGAYSCLVGEWVLPILSVSLGPTGLTGECVWQNVFTAGVAGDSALVRMTVTIQMKVEAGATTIPATTSCSRLEIEFLSCRDCNGEPMQAPPGLTLDMSDRSCGITYGASDGGSASGLDVGGCACIPFTQNQLVQQVVATAEPGYTGACWELPEFTELSGTVRVRAPRIENSPPPDLVAGADLAALEDDFEFVWSAAPCVWEYGPSNPTPERFSSFNGADSPRDPTERLCDNSVAVLRPYPLTGVTVPGGYTLAQAGAETSVVMACSGSLNPEDGRIQVGLVDGTYPITVQVEWIPPKRNTCHEQLGYRLDAPCPEDQVQDEVCSGCETGECGEPVVPGAGPAVIVWEYAMPFLQRTAVGFPTTLPTAVVCSEPTAFEGSGNCECPEEGALTEYDYCSCALFSVSIPTVMLASDDAPAGARYEVQYTYLGVVYSMVYTKSIGAGNYGLWTADWDVSTAMPLCVCVDRCADFEAELRDKFKFTNDAPTGRVPGESLAPAGVSVETELALDEVLTTFEVVAWYQSPERDPCCDCSASLNGATFTCPSARCDYAPVPLCGSVQCSGTNTVPANLLELCCHTRMTHLTVVDEEWQGRWNPELEVCECMNYGILTREYEFTCIDGVTTYNLNCEQSGFCEPNPARCDRPAESYALTYYGCEDEITSTLTCTDGVTPDPGLGYCVGFDGCMDANGIPEGADPVVTPTQLTGCQTRTVTEFVTALNYGHYGPEECREVSPFPFECDELAPGGLQRRKTVTVTWGAPGETCCVEELIAPQLCVPVEDFVPGPCENNRCWSFSTQPFIRLQGRTSEELYNELVACALLGGACTEVLVFFRGGCGGTICAKGEWVITSPPCDDPATHTGDYFYEIEINVSAGVFFECCEEARCVTLLGYQFCDPPTALESAERIAFSANYLLVEGFPGTECDLVDSFASMLPVGDSVEGGLVLTGIDGLTMLMA